MTSPSEDSSNEDERYPAPYIATSPVAPPVNVCRRHADALVERGKEEGIEIMIGHSMDFDAQCQSCINEAKRKK